MESENGIRKWNQEMEPKTESENGIRKWNQNGIRKRKQKT